MSREFFTSQDVVELVGVTQVHLNALVHRKLYGIKPSISGAGRKVRIFDEDDLYGIAFVWILFESGLRTEEIRSILSSLTNCIDARYTAQGWFEQAGAEDLYLIVIPDMGNPNRNFRMQTSTAQPDEIAGIIESNPMDSVLVIPIGPRFAEIKKRIETKFGG